MANDQKTEISLDNFHTQCEYIVTIFVVAIIRGIICMNAKKSPRKIEGFQTNSSARTRHAAAPSLSARQNRMARCVFREVSDKEQQ